MGTAFLFMVFIRPAIQTMAARDWVEVPCRIESADVKTHSGSDGSTYSIEVRYIYEYGGKVYTGDCYAFHSMSSSSRGWRDKAVARLRSSPKSVCFVNPADPAEAVLDRGLSSDIGFGLIPLVFILVGICCMVAGVRALIAKKEPVVPLSPGGATASGQAAWVPGPDKALHGPLTVDTGGRALKRFIGLSMVTLIWNGFVAFMAVMLARGDGPPWFFIGLFGLVGLGLFVALVYSTLALANPSARITLSQNPVPLGTNLRVAWQFSGNARRFDHLAIRLTCEEVTSYRRGTNTITERATMLDVVAMETRAAWEMGSGEAAVAIPAHAMHSFKAGNNAIEWKIVLHGSIPRWPDVREEIVLQVAPLER